MKKNYIKPITAVKNSSITSMILDVSPWRVENGAPDGSYNGVNMSDTKVDNDYSGDDPISIDANIRGGFDGAWESLW